jgi:hypothetical protein
MWGFGRRLFNPRFSTMAARGSLFMKQHTKIRQQAKERQGRCLSHSVSLHVPLRAADAKRSVENILQWNCYLPIDCVKTMVRMGWDYTT